MANDPNDPRETFQRDQAEAQSQAEDAFRANLRNGLAAAELTEARARRETGRAAVWFQLALTVAHLRRALLAAVFVVAAAHIVADVLPEWFR